MQAKDQIYVVVPPPNSHDELATREREMPDEEELFAARAWLAAFPLSQYLGADSIESAALRNVTSKRALWACTASQLATVQNMTGLADIFSCDSPAAEWLLMRITDFIPVKSTYFSYFDPQLAVATEHVFCPTFEVEHALERSYEPTVNTRRKPFVYLPNYLSKSYQSILGTMVHAPGQTGPLSSSTQCSHFVVHLPTGTLLYVTSTDDGSIVLDRWVFGDDRNTSFESIMIDKRGETRSCLFGEVICQYCAYVQTRRSRCWDFTLYPGCMCSSSIRQRVRGLRKVCGLTGWADFASRLGKQMIYAVGVFSPKLCGDRKSQRPWMIATLKVQWLEDRLNEKGKRLGAAMLQSLQFPNSSNPSIPFKNRTLPAVTSAATIVDDEKHRCPICAKECHSPGLLKEHVRTCQSATYQPGPLNVCKICKKSFSQAGHLKRHIRRMHTKIECSPTDKDRGTFQYNCNYCEASFASVANLSRHTRVGHKRGLPKE